MNSWRENSHEVGVINAADTTPVVYSRRARSPEELFPLVDFCRAGKLKDVAEWIATGKPLDPPLTAKRTRRQSPLEIAIDKGFFALAELLLDGGCDPLANGNVLSNAVSRQETEIAKLLLDRGVPPDSVHISAVFDAGRPMLEMFIERGLDPTAGQAYFEALCSKVHPLLFLIKEFGNRFPDLQRQVDMALSYHCEKGNARNVGLLLWAGARPDAQVADPNYTGDDSTSSALSIAVRQGRIDILKQLKPQNYPEELKSIIADAWLRPSLPLIDYLVGLGVPLNDKKNGGCSVIEHLLWSIGWRTLAGYSSNPTEVIESLTIIKHLCSLGAKWLPDEDESLRTRRDRFRKIDPQNLRELFRIFKETGAASVELLDSIIASPALRKSLGVHLRSIEEVLHPPPPKKRSAPTSSEAKKVEAKSLPPTVGEMRACARELLLDVVRQAPSLHFTNEAVASYHETRQLRKRLGMPKDDDREVQPIMDTAAANLNDHLRFFRVKLEWSGRSSCRLTATLNQEADWSEALKEAWDFAEKKNDSFLTDVALDLRELVLSGELGCDWNTERSIGFKVGLHGREHVLEPYLQEIENKTNVPIVWEHASSRWPEPPRFRITIRHEAVSLPRVGDGINPRIDVSFHTDRKQDRDRVTQLLYDELLKAQPEGKEPFFFFTISSRADLKTCLPQFESANKLAEFFHDLPVHQSLVKSFDFRRGAKRWFIAFDPVDKWNLSLKAIEEERSRPGLSEKYGISADAAKLLEWIQGLSKDQYTGPWTPIVENALDRWIGIRCPWAEENFPAYLQMLLDELNEQTEYDLSIQPWHHRGAEKSRLRVRPKRLGIDHLVNHLRVLAITRGVAIELDVARGSIEALLTQKQNDNRASAQEK